MRLSLVIEEGRNFPLDTLDFSPPGGEQKRFVSTLSLFLSLFLFFDSDFFVSFFPVYSGSFVYVPFCFCVLFSSLANPSFSFLDLNYCLEEFDDNETESSRVVHGTTEEKRKPHSVIQCNCKII